MAATAENLRDLHALHQRAKALRDRLESGPKTLEAREKVLAGRQAALEQARKALKDGKAHVKNREVQLQTVEARIDDLKGKRNAIKKQVDYDAITNQIAHDTAARSKLEDEILEAMTRIDENTTALATLEAEAKKLADDVAALRAQLASQTSDQRTQLAELERAIAEAEAIIPADQRDQYRRVVKQRGADAFAAVEGGACTGCFVSVTAQTINELINVTSLNFCKTCGRILYLAEDEAPVTSRRGGR